MAEGVAERAVPILLASRALQRLLVDVVFDGLAPEGEVHLPEHGVGGQRFDRAYDQAMTWQRRRRAAT